MERIFFSPDREYIYVYMEMTTAIFLRFPIIARELILGYLICIIERGEPNNRGGTNCILGNKLLARVVPSSPRVIESSYEGN